MALGFIYAVLLSLFAGVVIWSLLALMLGGMVLLSAILCVHAGWLDVPTDAYSTPEGALGAVAQHAHVRARSLVSRSSRRAPRAEHLLRRAGTSTPDSGSAASS